MGPDIVERLLPDIRRFRVLDVCCGTGRHLNALGRLGATGLGIDTSKDFLDIARRDAPEGVRYVLVDSRELIRHTKPESFDVALSMFSSIGQLPQAADQEIFGAVRRALRPGGAFLVHHENLLWHARHVDERWWYDAGDLLRIGHSTLDALSGLLSIEEQLYGKGGGKVHERSWSVRVYSLHAIAAMLEAAGLRVRTVMDSFGNETRTPTTVRLYLVAERA